MEDEAETTRPGAPGRDTSPRDASRGGARGADPENAEKAFADSIGRSATRKITARHEPRNTVWQGVGLMGMVGWSVAVPTLLGAFFGRWLDSRAAEGGSRSWTLVMLAAGVAVGCVNAWRWVARESARNRDFNRNLRRMSHMTRRMTRSVTRRMLKGDDPGKDSQ